MTGQGGQRELEAAHMQSRMLNRGDDEGRLQWARIGRAIEALRAEPRGKPN
jgi:hypothetical protein